MLFVLVMLEGKVKGRVSEVISFRPRACAMPKIMYNNKRGLHAHFCLYLYLYKLTHVKILIQHKIVGAFHETPKRTTKSKKRKKRRKENAEVFSR